MLFLPPTIGVTDRMRSGNPKEDIRALDRSRRDNRLRLDPSTDPAMPFRLLPAQAR